MTSLKTLSKWYLQWKKKENYNLDVALSCNNFFVSLKNKIGPMQFLKEALLV